MSAPLDVAAIAKALKEVMRYEAKKLGALKKLYDTLNVSETPDAVAAASGAEEGEDLPPPVRIKRKPSTGVKKATKAVPLTFEELNEQAANEVVEAAVKKIEAHPGIKFGISYKKTKGGNAFEELVCPRLKNITVTDGLILAVLVHSKLKEKYPALIGNKPRVRGESTDHHCIYISFDLPKAEPAKAEPASPAPAAKSGGGAGAEPTPAVESDNEELELKVLGGDIYAVREDKLYAYDAASKTVGPYVGRLREDDGIDFDTPEEATPILE